MGMSFAYKKALTVCLKADDRLRSRGKRLTVAKKRTIINGLCIYGGRKNEVADSKKRD